MFGGPCQTPNFEKLAAEGLRYNRFHTTALCAPTRAALLTGRNHHSVGMGGSRRWRPSAPGYKRAAPQQHVASGRDPKTKRLQHRAVRQMPRSAGVADQPDGPFNAWPTGGGGFEYFYGFLGGETNQWYPALYEGTTPIEPQKTPKRAITSPMTWRPKPWVRQQKALMPDKPFFIYFAPGATHAPHHVPKEWADKYKGKFDQGWDKVREETFARQKDSASSRRMQN